MENPKRRQEHVVLRVPALMVIIVSVGVVGVLLLMLAFILLRIWQLPVALTIAGIVSLLAFVMWRRRKAQQRLSRKPPSADDIATLASLTQRINNTTAVEFCELPRSIHEHGPVPGTVPESQRLRNDLEKCP